MKLFPKIASRKRWVESGRMGNSVYPCLKFCFEERPIGLLASFLLSLPPKIKMVRFKKRIISF